MSRGGGGGGGEDESNDGMVDGSFHSPAWHAARLAALQTTNTLTWEEWKAQRKEEARKQQEMEGFEEQRMKEYRAQLDKEREARLSRGRNHADKRGKLKKKKDKDKNKKKVSKFAAVLMLYHNLVSKSRTCLSLISASCMGTPWLLFDIMFGTIQKKGKRKKGGSESDSSNSSSSDDDSDKKKKKKKSKKDSDALSSASEEEEGPVRLSSFLEKGDDDLPGSDDEDELPPAKGKEKGGDLSSILAEAKRRAEIGAHMVAEVKKAEMIRSGLPS
ncbi:unnamed protein product [Closterium sp. Yama58-4]|nr:unnamed protein product [Closterium sp. Yama58-4]